MGMRQSYKFEWATSGTFQPNLPNVSTTNGQKTNQTVAMLSF